MILTILAILIAVIIIGVLIALAIGAIGTIGALGVTLLVTFGDLIVFIGVIWLLVKLFKRKKK